MTMGATRGGIVGKSESQKVRRESLIF